MGKKLKLSDISIVVGLCALWVFSFWKSRLGMHSDEVQQIAVGDMIARGDSFFKECWFYLQMSAVFTAPVIKIYSAIIGSNEGILLFFRILSIFVQTIICIYFYFTFRGKFNKYYVLIAAVVLFVFVPDFQSFNYKQEIIWFSILQILFVYHYYISGKTKYILLLGVAISASVLAYPTSIIQFPLYLLILFCIDKKRIKSCLQLSITCCVCGILFMIWVLSKISITEFVEFFPKVFADENLDKSFISKLAHPTAKFAILGIATCAPMYIVRRYKERFPNMQYLVMLTLLWIAFLGQCYIERKGITWHCVTYPYSLTIFMLPMMFYDEKEKRDILVLFEIPAIVLALVIALASNQGNITSMYGTVITTVALILMLSTRENSLNKVILISVLFFALSMFAIPVWEQEAVEEVDETERNIFTERELVSNGPAKGLCLGELTYPDYETICRVIEKYVGMDDKLLLVEDSPMAAYGYLCSSGEYATYSPHGGLYVSTSDKAVRYFNDNPQKEPDIVIVSLSYIEMDIDTYLSTSYVGNYLNENLYNVIDVVDGYAVLSNKQ